MEDKQHTGVGRPRGRWSRRIWALLTGLAVVAIALIVRFGFGGREANAGSPTGVRSATAAAAQTAPRTGAGAKASPSPTAAIVDGRPITRTELADECLKRFGQEVLSSVTNKYLIVQHCREKNIEITPKEVDEEIQKTARRFGIPVDQWLSMLQAERDISAEHYASDVVWPTLALRKLAADQLQVSDDEIVKGFESRFGAQVRLRLISLSSREEADKVQRMAAAKPEEFARLAVKYSTDVDSASAGGMIPPVRKNVGEPRLEQIAFALKAGEVSQVIPINSQFLILKCEEQIPPHPPTKAIMAAAEQEIANSIRDRKLRTAGTKLFGELQKNAKIQNVLNDPKASALMPGVAALVNGERITTAQLAEECVARYGRQVLQGLIQHTLLTNALARRQLAITPEDVDAEIARAALAADVVGKDGKPDVKRWIEMYTKQQRVSVTIYRSDVVWPTVALKKLVDGQVQITDEDLQKGFEANYGPRVRVRAIVLDNQRRAQQVWDMARRDPTVENFGRLAEEYSVEPGSRSLQGQVPPIQMYGGQPALEQDAFALKVGEISGIIQLLDKFVILYCEGRTKPVVVDRNEVADLLRGDIQEKKYRIAMSKEFERIQAASRVDNVLDPKASHTPEVKRTASKSGRAVSLGAVADPTTVQK